VRVPRDDNTCVTLSQPLITNDTEGHANPPSLLVACPSGHTKKGRPFRASPSVGVDYRLGSNDPDYSCREYQLFNVLESETEREIGGQVQDVSDAAN
jgi:hypothetical protein